MITSIAAALSLTFGGRWWQTGLFSIIWLGVPVIVGLLHMQKDSGGVSRRSGAAISIVGTLAINYLVEGRQKTLSNRHSGII
jgi:hypothetical protein